MLHEILNANDRNKGALVFVLRLDSSEIYEQNYSIFLSNEFRPTQ